MDSIDWAAGLFEGEGCITRWTVRGKYVQATAKLSMVDEDIVRRFAAVIGVGKVTRAEPQREGWQAQFHWRTTSKADTRKAIEMMLPFFGARRTEKALEILEFCRPGISNRVG